MSFLSRISNTQQSSSLFSSSSSSNSSSSPIYSNSFSYLSLEQRLISIEQRLTYSEASRNILTVENQIFKSQIKDLTDQIQQMKRDWPTRSVSRLHKPIPMRRPGAASVVQQGQQSIASDLADLPPLIPVSELTDFPSSFTFSRSSDSALNISTTSSVSTVAYGSEGASILSSPSNMSLGGLSTESIRNSGIDKQDDALELPLGLSDTSSSPRSKKSPSQAQKGDPPPMKKQKRSSIIPSCKKILNKHDGLLRDGKFSESKKMIKEFLENTIFDSSKTEEKYYFLKLKVELAIIQNNSGKPREAAKILKKVLKDEQATPELKSLAYYQLSLSYSSSERHAKAQKAAISGIECHDELAKRDPWLYNQSARTLVELEKYVEAEKAVRTGLLIFTTTELVEKHPSANAKIWLNYNLIRALHGQKKYKLTMKLAEECMDLYKEDKDKFKKLYEKSVTEAILLQTQKPLQI